MFQTLWKRLVSLVQSIWLAFVGRPLPPTKLGYRIIGVDMKVAITRVYWTPSPSKDVVSQSLVLKFNGDVHIDESLDAAVDSYEVRIPEKTSVTVELVAFDSVRGSIPAILDFRIGDLEAPVAPTFLSPGYEILSIVDEDPTA